MTIVKNITHTITEGDLQRLADNMQGRSMPLTDGIGGPTIGTISNIRMVAGKLVAEMTITPLTPPPSPPPH